MAALAARARAYARAQQVDLPGPLSGGQEWDIVDSTPVPVRDARCDDGPGTGAYAASKVPQVLSVGCGARGRYHVSPARAHDSRPLQIDASWRGYGRLADLADASRARLRACDTDDVRVVIRLQDHGTPTVDDIARGQVTHALFPGTARDARLADEPLVREGRAIDADGPVGGGTNPLPRRLVGVQTPTGDGFCRTNLPPRVGPRQGADRSRGRWAGALRIKLDQSVNRLDASDTERPCARQTRLHAARMAATIAAIRAHRHHRHTCPPQVGAPRTEAPLHTRLLALPLAVSCQSIAQAVALPEAEAKRRWAKIAALLTHSGQDPNGRRRPSVFDQLRGWKRQPRARAKHRTHRLEMAA